MRGRQGARDERRWARRILKCDTRACDACERRCGVSVCDAARDAKQRIAATATLRRCGAAHAATDERRAAVRPRASSARHPSALRHCPARLIGTAGGARRSRPRRLIAPFPLAPAAPVQRQRQPWCVAGWALRAAAPCARDAARADGVHPDPAGVQVLGRRRGERERGGGGQLGLGLGLFFGGGGGEEGALQVRGGGSAGESRGARKQRWRPPAGRQPAGCARTGPEPRAARRYLRGSDSDSDSDDGKRVVRSAKARGKQVLGLGGAARRAPAARCAAARCRRLRRPPAATPHAAADRAAAARGVPCALHSARAR